MTQLVGRLRRRRQGEGGFTIVEVLVAITILIVGATAFSTTTSNGLRLVGTSQERQTAVAIAGKWMEQARSYPYASVALDSSTVFGGVGTPDADVHGTTYSGPAGDEQLVLADGTGFDHEATEQPSGVEYDVYRYVTWVPEGAVPQAYKRVTVVVWWNGTSHHDATGAKVVQSTIISAGGVGWTSTTTAPAAPATTTTTSSTTTTTAPGTCAGDTTPPTGSIGILAGTGANTGYTSSSTVNLTLTASDPCAPITMAFSNDGSTYSAWEPFATSRAWPLTSGNGNRTVWVHFRDGAGNVSVASATVRVDGTPPSTPGSFTAKAKNNPTRVELNWTASTDNDTLIGYRIYVAAGSGSFQNQASGVTAPCSTNPCLWTHTGVNKKDVYTYYVVAYDAAGNESAATAHITVTVP